MHVNLVGMAEAGVALNIDCIADMHTGCTAAAAAAVDSVHAFAVAVDNIEPAAADQLVDTVADTDHIEELAALHIADAGTRLHLLASADA